MAFWEQVVGVLREAIFAYTLTGHGRPELDAVRTRFKSDPGRVAEETRRVFQREGISILAAVGSRFFWIADISRPDRVQGLLVRRRAQA